MKTEINSHNTIQYNEINNFSHVVNGDVCPVFLAMAMNGPSFEGDQ